MAWIAALLDQVPRAHLEDASEAMWDCGAQGVEVLPATGLTQVLRQPWDDGPEAPPPERLLLKAWFEDPNPQAVTAAALAVWPDAVLTWSDEGADVDWESAWKEGFEVIVEGPITIAPFADCGLDDVIVIEPGQGFGTGAHATTRQALAMLVDVLTTDEAVRTVLDVGTGSGLLALAAARLGRTAHGIDIAPEAIEEARKTALNNGLVATFDTTPVDDLVGPYDLVVANVHAEALTAMAATLTRLASRHLLVAGILADKEPWLRDALDPIWGPPKARDVQEDAWVALRWSR